LTPSAAGETPESGAGVLAGIGELVRSLVYGNWF
jgi:hypothetical protein